MFPPPPSFCRAVEQFIRKCPAHINIKKDDGYTPLHLAALNDHLDALTVLLESVRDLVLANEPYHFLHTCIDHARHMIYHMHTPRTHTSLALQAHAPQAPYIIIVAMLHLLLGAL